VLKLSLLLVLLPLTLGWKLAVRPGGTSVLSEREVQRSAADFLARQRFAVAAVPNPEEGQPMLRAEAGLCRIIVVHSPSLGWDRDLVRRHATADDQVFVVFRGRIFDEQPTFLTVSNFLWARLRIELGLDAQASPVFAVVATKSCAAERLPWDELGSG
jgi:hypothetical protein